MFDIFKNIPLPKKEPSVMYDCGDNAYMLRYESCSVADYRFLGRDIQSSGFSLYQASDIDDNLFSVFYRDITIYLYFCPKDKTLSITAEKSLPCYQTIPVTSGKAKTTLWQFEVDHSLIDCGMCYIVRCDDGSFFVVDSAHYFSVRDDERIINFLKEQSGEKIPRISGWFFSHAHDDHICKFIDIMKYYSDKIQLDAVYFNFPSADHKDRACWDSNFKQLHNEFYNSLKYSPKAKIIKLHTGMHFAVKNLEFKVYCTHEDVYPNDLSDFNNTSVFLMMKVENTKVCFPGDCSSQSNKVLLSRYNESLKCDVMQMSHHGHSGLSPEFYEKAKADCVLFPITLIKYDEEWDNQPANKKAVELCKEYYIASDGTVEIPLPYKPGKCKVYPDEIFENFTGIKHLWGYDYTDERKEELRQRYLKKR